jgi:hypothetical protein
VALCLCGFNRNRQEFSGRMTALVGDYTGSIDAGPH